MKIAEESKLHGICIQNMIDGEIGEIIMHPDNTKHIGSIVQRFDDKVIVLGKSKCACFGAILNETKLHDNFRVRILPKGTKLEI